MKQTSLSFARAGGLLLAVIGCPVSKGLLRDLPALWMTAERSALGTFALLMLSLVACLCEG